MRLRFKGTETLNHNGIVIEFSEQVGLWLCKDFLDLELV
jgi:hypothetical protein